MTPDITQYIAYEVKKEIADRYFGFRKLIEDDELDYREKARQYAYILEKRISFDMIRLYIMLKEEELIRTFMEIAGLEERLFYDALLAESETIQERVFQGVRFRGLTRGRRFRSFGLACYDRLSGHIDQYAHKVAELEGMRETIKEEISLFYRKNDICAILAFLRSTGNNELSSGMAGGMEVGMAEALEKKLQIKPPVPIEQYLPIIPPLRPLEQTRSDLDRLLKQAYRLHDESLLAIFGGSFPFTRSPRHKARATD